MTFPQYLPLGCPPAAAPPACGEVFRVVKSDPPDDTDFRTPYEAGTLPTRPLCLRCALSVARMPDDVVHLRSVYPQLGSLVAGGVLEVADGVLQPSPNRLQPTHETWWPFDGIQRERNFKVIQGL